MRDTHIPKQVLYQAELRPDARKLGIFGGIGKAGLYLAAQKG